MLLEGTYSLSRTENAVPKRLLGNGYEGVVKSNWDAGSLLGKKLICLIVVSDRPA
jgi:hypothetical protein